MGFIARAELTHKEKAALGKLMGAYTSGDGWMHLAPADPDRVVFDALTHRGEWVEKRANGGYKITNYGMSAFYTGRIVKGGR